MKMISTATIFLGLSVAAFSASFTSGGETFCFGILRPFSAVMFILFFIFQLLEKEITKFDAEHRGEVQPRTQSNRVPSKASTSAPRGLVRAH